MYGYCFHIFDFFSKTAAWNVLILPMHVPQGDLYQVCEGDDEAIIFLFFINFLIYFLKKIEISSSEELLSQLL